MSEAQLLLLCRNGFESECAQDYTAVAAAQGLAVRGVGVPRTGLVEVTIYPPGDAAQALRRVPLSALIFARQILRLQATVQDLPKKDRLTPVLATIAAVRGRACWTSLEVLVCDDAGDEALQRFARKFASPLAAALRRDGALTPERSDRDPLIVIFESFQQARVATLDPVNRADAPDGVMRLRFPPEAPSRSTLKLEEAWRTFIPEARWFEWLGGGVTAVDLGAAPGGWTWQLVNQGMEVTAIDNGDMDAALLRSGQVTHLRTDGFTYRPPAPVAWMVCDMVEQPARVLDLVANWLVRGWCRHTVFNLKLPMKQRYAEVTRGLDNLRERLEASGLAWHLQARQLYHDREEITVMVLTGEPALQMG